MAIHPTAYVDPQAEVHSSVEIGPRAVIDGPVKIGAGTQIGPAAVVMGSTTVGENCEIHSHAVVGDICQDRAYRGGETFLQIGNECVIREGVTIHRGTAEGSATVLGDRCYLMTNSHVGHNCILGDDVMLVSGSLLGGYVEVGHKAIISGNAAVHQYVRVGELAMVSALAKIVMDVPPFFMTDRDGAIVGVNRVGLTRAGMSEDEKDELKRAHRLMYRSQKTRLSVLQQMQASMKTSAGQRLLAFMAQDSPRGVTKGVRLRVAA